MINFLYLLKSYFDIDILLEIMAPVQTANPFNYGGDVLSIGLGLNTVLDLFGGKHKDRFSFEIIKPIDQNKNGLQMKNDLTIQIGFQKML